MYAGDDYYEDFRAYAMNHSSPDGQAMPRAQFYEVCGNGPCSGWATDLHGPLHFMQRFVKWNINHHMGMAEQLRAGIRWFHLKVCVARAMLLEFPGVYHHIRAPRLPGLPHA